MKKILSSRLALAFAGLAWLTALGGCGQDAANQGAVPPPAVVVTTVTPQTVPISREFVARTEARETVEIRARVEGFLEKVFFKEGSKVKAGQLIFLIDQRPYKAALQDAKGQLAQARAAYGKADKDIERLKPLVAADAAPRQDLDKAESEAEFSRASIEKGKAAVARAELDLKFTEIRAPLTGVIGKEEVAVGNLVMRDRTLLTTISSLDPMRAVFSISEKDYLLLADRFPEALFQAAQGLVAAASRDPAIAALFNTFQANVPQVKLDVDRDKVQTLGIPLRSVFDGLQLYLGGYMINDFNKFGRVYRVMVQAKPEFRRTPEDIVNIYVRNATGQMVPLSTLVNVGSQTGPILLNRYNMFRAAELTGQNAPGYSSGDAIAAMERLSRNLPRGFGYEWTGLAFQEKLAGGQTVYIFAFSLLFVFLVLAALYESWAITLGVLLGLPIPVFGALLGVWARGLANDVYVQVGIVMLIGLNAKLSIMIVEFARNKRDLEGFSTFEAATEGARLRFRAIVMTALAEVVGLMPLLLASGAGAAARWSVGTAIVAGMAMATLLSVFFIPVLYFAVITLTEKLGGQRAAAGQIGPGPAPRPP